MKYTVDAAVTEITARSKRRRNRREKSTVRALSLSCLVLAALLAGTMTPLPLTASAGVPAATYGSLLLGAATGGYVIVAVAAFTAAVAITLAVTRCRDKKRRK